MTIADKIIAHRGASNYAPENTLAAFSKAYELGAKWVEFDVILSADNVPVIFHDETTTRTTNQAGKNITSLTLQQIKALDAGSWFSPKFANEGIPTLEETLAFLKSHDMFGHIELKKNPGQEANTVLHVLEVFNKFWPLERKRHIFSSFDENMLAQLHLADADLSLALTRDRWNMQEIPLLRELNCEAIHLNDHYLSKDQAEAVLALGYDIRCFTVNEHARGLTLFEWGIAGIFTNNIDHFPEFLT